MAIVTSFRPLLCGLLVVAVLTSSLRVHVTGPGLQLRRTVTLDGDQDLTAP